MMVGRRSGFLLEWSLRIRSFRWGVLHQDIGNLGRVKERLYVYRKISVLKLQKWWGCDSAKVFGHTKIISIIGCCDALKQPTWGCLARFGVGEDVQGAVERNQDVALKG